MRGRVVVEQECRLPWIAYTLPIPRPLANSTNGMNVYVRATERPTSGPGSITCL